MPENLNYTHFFAALAVLASIVRYALYFKNTFQGSTKPHIFTWINWSTVAGISGLAQLSLGGGLSGYILLFLAATDMLVVLCALKYGEKDITKSDTLTFTGALMLIPLWMATQDPFLIILLIIVIDILGFYPTMRKSWLKPFEEPISSFTWAGLRYFFTLFSIANPTWENLTFILFLMLYKWSFVLYLMWRRKVVLCPQDV